jgi:hypothetical protein
MQIFWAFKLSFVVDCLAWRLFGLLFEKMGDVLSSGHPGLLNCETSPLALRQMNKLKLQSVVI